MSPLKLCIAVALVFAAIALVMLLVPRARKRRHKRQRRWNNTRPKYDMSRAQPDEGSDG